MIYMHSVNKLLNTTTKVSKSIFNIIKGGFISKSQTHYHKRKQPRRKLTRKRTHK